MGRHNGSGSDFGVECDQYSVILLAEAEQIDIGYLFGASNHRGSEERSLSQEQKHGGYAGDYGAQ